MSASACSGRTTRVILEALIALSRGRDVMIVAVPMTESVRIAKRVISAAKAFGIPCRNVRNSDSDGPVVRARTLDTPIPLPTPMQAVVIDHSAVFERGSTRAEAVRTVLTIGL